MLSLGGKIVTIHERGLIETAGNVAERRERERVNINYNHYAETCELIRRINQLRRFNVYDII